MEFYPKNWTGFKKSLWGCSVVFNPSSVQFIPQEVYTASSEAAFDEAFRLVRKVQDYLSENYVGLVLAPLTVVYSQHYARLLDPLAIEFQKTSKKENVNLSYRGDRIAVDCSRSLPELETLHKVFAKDDLVKIAEFYEDLVKTGFRIGDIEDLKEAAELQAMAGTYLAYNLKTHVDVLKEIKKAIMVLREAVNQVSQ